MLCMEASRAARASAICRSVAAAMICDLGFEDEEDEAVGEVVDWAGSGLVVDMVLLGGRMGYWDMQESLHCLLLS
jgi:hypothetical protein